MLRPSLWFCISLFCITSAFAATDELVSAASQGDLGEVKRIVDSGYVEFQTLNSAEAAAIAAVRGGHRDIARLLIESGNGIVAIFGHEQFETLLELEEEELAELCWSQILRVAARPGEEELPAVLFRSAAHAAHIRSMKFFVARGVPHDDNDPVSGTPLFAAIRTSGMGKLEAVKYLLGLGVDIEAVHQVTGKTPLTAAVFDGTPEILDAILSANPDLNRVDGDGNTALTIAAKFSTDALIRLLKEPGIDPNRADEAGMTPLMHAADLGQDRNVVELLDAGADVSVRTRDGRTAEAIAANLGHRSIVRLLRGDEDLARKFRRDEELALRPEDAAYLQTLFEAWFSRDYRAVEAMLHPEFDSFVLHVPERELPRQLRRLKPRHRVLEYPFFGGMECVDGTTAAERCLIANYEGRAGFNADVTIADSDAAMGFESLRRRSGDPFVTVEAAIRGTGLGLLMILEASDAKARVLAIEFVPF
jgi:hypothetical protein